MKKKVEFNCDMTQKWLTMMYWKLDTFLKELLSLIKQGNCCSVAKLSPTLLQPHGL